MRWLPPRSHKPRTTSQPRSSAQRGSNELLREDSGISSNWENINPPGSNDNGDILQEAIPSEHNSHRRWTNQLAMGDATLSDPDDRSQTICAEEALGWKNGVQTQLAALWDRQDVPSHSSGEPQPNQSAALTKHNQDTVTGKATQAGIPDSEVSDLDLRNEGRTPATIASGRHAVESHCDLQDETSSAGTYHDATDLPGHLSLPESWMDDAVVSDDPGLSTSGDGPSSNPSLSSSAAPPKKKPRQFPLAIPKPSFNFIPKNNADSPKKPTRLKSALPKLPGRSKSDDSLKPATTKKLRFSSVVESSKPPTRRRLPPIPLGRKKSDGSRKSSLASSRSGSRSGEISPLAITEPEGSFVLPAFAEPTDVLTEPSDAPGSIPKPKRHKPSKFSFKLNNIISLTSLSPTAVTPVPDQPYEHIPSPEEPDPRKKLRLGRFEKVKGGFQRGVRWWRKFTLRKGVLQVMLGRQLAGPVHANLRVLAGRKMVLEGGPPTGLWGIADGRLGERSLSGRPV